MAAEHRRRRNALTMLALTASAAYAACPLAADPTATQTAQAATITPRDAGARYGQALGAVEVCYGSKITAKAHALSETYLAADQDAFKAQTAKIYDAWIKVKGCTDQVSPNKCKVIMDKSCLAAEAEIGASGSAIPGLVEFAKH